MASSNVSTNNITAFKDSTQLMLASGNWSQAKPALAHSSERFSSHNLTISQSGFASLWENPTPSKNTRILVVGEKVHSGGVTAALEKSGYTVTQIESQVQALEIIADDNTYKLACVYSSGNPAVLQFITKLNEISTIPIVVIATGADLTSKLLKAGASDCLYTPICFDLLKIRISCILENLQLKETLRISRMSSQAPAVDHSVKVNGGNFVVDELKATIAELEKRIAWGDAELEKKDLEMITLQQQLSAVSWRTSLLESEKHKGETLSQQLTQKEREIDDMKKSMSRALETPIQVITRTLLQLSQGNLDQTQLRQAITTLVQSISSSSQLYQPAFTKSQFLQSLNLDDMTRQWLVYEFTTTGLDNTTTIVSPAPTSAPSTSPILTQSSVLLSASPPLRSISPSPQDLHHSLKVSTDNRPRSPMLDHTDARPRSPRLLPPVNQSDMKLTGPESRILRSGRSVDDILKRATTTDMPAIQNYNCNVWLFDQEEVALLTWTMFEDLGLVSQFKIPQVAFFQLMETLKGCYLSNPYHNYQHAFDVCQTCYLFVKTCNVRQYISQMDVFAMMVAAICHDIDHPGLNNTYQINSRSPLAILYNDLSVLENHHCARAFYILNDPKNNILTGLTPAEYKEFRRTVVSAILATDMTTHFELLTRFTTHLDARPFSIENKDDRQLIVDILLHSADISNTCKPFVISKRWSDLLLEEFLNQGDMEKEHNMPVSPFMNRQSTDHVRMTLNFMDYMVAPLCASLAKLFTGMRPLLENLQLNRAQWAEKATEPVKVKFPEYEKTEQVVDKLTNGIRDKKISRSFGSARSGYDMLKGSSPNSAVPNKKAQHLRRLSFDKGSIDTRKLSDPPIPSSISPTLPPPPAFAPTKLLLPKLAASMHD